MMKGDLKKREIGRYKRGGKVRNLRGAEDVGGRGMPRPGEALVPKAELSQGLLKKHSEK